MAGGLSNYLENAFAAWMFTGTQMPTPPTSVYLGAFTTEITDAAGGTEVSGGGYARPQIPCNAATWNMPTNGNGLVTNAGNIVFPKATADWGVIVAIGIFDSIGGPTNMLARCSVIQAYQQVINNNDQLVILPLQLQFVLD